MTIDPREYSSLVKSRSGRLYPDLVNSVALKNLPRETAEAEGWPTYYMPEPCQFGHVSSRFTKNTQCVDCWRLKQGREVLYPLAKNRTYRKPPDPKAPEAAGVPLVVAAKNPEPSRREQDFLAALAETADFNTAAERAGMSRGQVESRASVDPTFRTALANLCERHGIPWTRAPDAKAFKWTREIEREFIARFIDTGLLEQARSDLGISASVYQAHLTDSPDFSAAVDTARPAAKETLRERAIHAATVGNDKLSKLLENDPEEGFARMPDGTMVRRLGNPEAMRQELTLILGEARKGLAAKKRLEEVCKERVAEQKTQTPDTDESIIDEVIE